jgi:hypothetical protein
MGAVLFRAPVFTFISLNNIAGAAEPAHCRFQLHAVEDVLLVSVVMIRVNAASGVPTMSTLPHQFVRAPVRRHGTQSLAKPGTTAA